MLPVPITQILTRTKFRDYWALEFGADLLHFNYDFGVVGGTGLTATAGPRSFRWSA
jgi:hypothetical protein